MAIVKLSKSGKQVQFVTDDGVVFATSVVALNNLISAGGKYKAGFVLLCKMPFAVSVERFGKSPLWDGEKLINDDGREVKGFSTSLGEDGLSKVGRSKVEDKKVFKDKRVNL